MAQLYQHNRCGQALVEVLLALGLSAILLPALLTGLVSSRQGKAQQQQRTPATALLGEAIEATRSVREKGWTTFAKTGTFHPVALNGVWSLADNSEQTSDGYDRSIVISDVQRDAVTGNIVASGGTVDPSTKKVTVTVSWSLPYQSQVTSELYVTRYLDNLVYIETTQAQLNAGVKSGVTITNNSGGEVTLGAGGQGDWCNPNLSIAALDLPKNGVANAISAIPGRVFAGTGENASGVSFANINVTDTNPPTSQILGTYDGYKTNSVFGESNYAYLATDNNSKEVEIINLTPNPYSEAGWFNTPFSNADATAVYVAGNRGYVTAGFWLYVFDLSSKSGSRPLVGFPHLLIGTGTSIVVSGNYAFVSVSGSPIEMQIIDVSNPWSIFQAGYADVNGQDGKHVFINSTATRAYLATNASASLSEFFVIDTSSKSGSRPTVGSYDASGMNPKDLAVVTGNKAILVGTGAEEYQVIDISNEASPVRCGGMNINTGINGVASVLEADSDAYSYIITGDSASELKIIEGGPGGQYLSSGTFVSAAFDPGYATSYNRVSFTGVIPNQTSLTAQVAISADCINYTFLGPDGTSSTFYSTTGGPIPLGFNTGRCMKYKLYLSTNDFNATPVFNDLTVNYSP